MATAQAQTAINQLKAAGFNRSEFSVRTDRIYCGRHPETGRPMYEYGDAVIHLRTSKAREYELIPAMIAQGLSVTIPAYKSKEDGEIHYSYLSVYSRPKSRLVLWETWKESGYQLGDIALAEAEDIIKHIATN